MPCGRAVAALISLAGCGDNIDGEPITDQLTVSFRMEETGHGPRRDHVNDLQIYPWKQIGDGVYQQDGIGTTLVPGVVGNGQHVDGADGYHFATYGHPLLNHNRGSFTWVGWASIDPPGEGTPYTDNQTLLAKWTGVPDTAVAHDRREYRVWFEPGLEQWRFEVSSDGLEGDGHSIVVTHPAAIERGRMYFVEAWHDADARTVNLGISDQDTRRGVASVAWDAGVFAGEADLDVAAQNACSDNHLQGTIDAFGYWRRALTEDELAELWNGGSGTEP